MTRKSGTLKRMTPGGVVAVASVDDGVIKNVYGEDETALTRILKELYDITEESVVPSAYTDIYRSAGYTVVEEKLKKFIKIRGGKANGTSVI